MTSPEIRVIVDRMYSEYLELPEDWTLSQRIEFLDQEAERISRLVAEAAAERGDREIEKWARRNGMQPDYLTHVGLLNSATSAAKEQVLHDELYSRIPAAADKDALMPDEEVPAELRWSSTRFAKEPSPELEDLVAAVWPEPAFSVTFQIKAGYLLAAREAQDLALPQAPGDALAMELAQLVYADLRRDGLPER